MSEPGIRELLEAGLHFGHQTRRWNPRMRTFIFGERDGIHIIDLLQTEKLLGQARGFAAEIAGQGGTVLFVGTKKQARDSVKAIAERCDMPFVNQRWLGGLLTNFQTIASRIDRLHELNGLKEDERLELLPTKERMSMEAELAKLEYNLGGVRDMKRLPDAVVVIDLKTEEIAVREAERLRIPIIGLVDSNVDPGPVSYPIPGNDDAIRSCDLVVSTLGEAIEEGSSAFKEAEARRREEETERRRQEDERRRAQEEEERQKRDQAERARQQAEASASGEAQANEAEAAAGEAAAKPAPSVQESAAAAEPDREPPTAPEAPAPEATPPDAAVPESSEQQDGR